jgi:hypothetical protein
LLQLKNNSPFESTIALFPNAQGVDTLYVVVKGTFHLHPSLSIAEKQAPITLADEFWGDPTTSSIKYASDIHLSKPSTDVVMNARAWAPNDRAVPQMDVFFSVAERQKQLRVFGDRVWRNGSISPAEPFKSMPVVYEYAFGGKYETDSADPVVFAEPRNPIGRGFRGKRKAAELEGLPLPNVEDPQCLVASAGDIAIPAGFSFISPAWFPRLSYAGTYDEEWQSSRAPYLPQDFDSRFFNAAHPDFTFDRYLQGGEPVRFDNLSVDGPKQFNLPACDLEARISMAGQIESPPINLETVLIEPDKRRLCMTWRSELACDKKALKVQQVEVNLRSLQLTGEAS